MIQLMMVLQQLSGTIIVNEIECLRWPHSIGKLQYRKRAKYVPCFAGTIGINRDIGVL